MKTNRKHNDLQIESLEPMVLMSASAADVEGDDAANALVGQAYESVNGGGGDDLIAGTRDNTLCGGDGDDLFTTGDGFNTIDGGEGTDTIRYSQFNRSEVSIVENSDGTLTISDGNKIDVVSNVEFFEFADQTVSLADIQNSINNAPVIVTSDHLSIAENQTEVATIVATDADGEDLFFSLSDAQDGASFEIDPNTGVLSFRVAPDFENPSSVNGTNVYDVTVRVTDCNTTTLKTFWVTVTDVDETGGGNNVPTFDNLNDNEVIEVNEGTLDVRDIDASDLDGDTITYSFSDGINTPGDGPNQDPGQFNLDPNTGELTFRVAPDFENPTDADGDNEYLVTVVISDGQSAVERDITVRVLDVNEGGTNDAPSFTNVAEGQIVTVPENTTFVGDANGVDPNGDAVTFSIAGGTDAALFQVDPTTGVVTFISAPDFENPADADGDNDYSLTLRISDGTLFQDRNVVVRVTDVTEGGTNNAPFFTNVAEGQNVTVPENTTFVGDANGVDPNGDNVTFSIVGGDDSGLFSIDAATGVVTFNTAPDFEAPADGDGNNVYALTLRISDGTLFQDRNVTVTVTDRTEGGTNDAPSFTNVSDGEIVTVPENTTFVGDANGVDPNGDAVTFSIAGGTDAALFQVNPTTGVVTFINAPDFEAPADANGDNDYNIVLRISDGTLFQDRNVVVRVTDVSDGGTSNQAPVFTNVEPNEQVTVVEGNTLVGDANASDPNGDAVTFSIVGGADAAFFSINPTTGVVTFNNAPDFETPLDADGNNIYSLTLRVSDGTLFQDRDITVRVLDAVEGGTNNAPVFTNVEEGEIVTVPENTTLVGDANGVDPNGDAVTFSIAGGTDAALFQVNPTTGVVTFINAPDFEAPADANGDNDYNIVLRISDGTLFQDRNVVVRVTDVSDGGTSNQAPVFTNVEPNEQVTVVEGNTLVGDANASDPNGDAVTFSIVGGADASFFSINPTTGVVTFNNAPDFETPLDADGNNIYSLTLRVSDGTLFQDRDITVRVLDAVEGGTNNAPVFTNVEEGEIVTVPENTTLVGDANGVDPNGDAVTFSIAGGTDAALFQVNPTTGVVTFINAPDFEAPADANGDNDYNIVLRISDGTLFQDRNVVVRVTDVSDGGTSNQAPVFTNVEPNEQVTVVEGNTLVGDANASDPNGDAVTFSIVGGADASFFSINPTTGVVTFNNAPDFETPLDADGNNIYSLTLRVSDGTLFQDRDITVRVLDAVEGGTNNAPVFTNVEEGEIVTVPENTTFVGDANGVDPNGDAVTFSIAGGTDAALFQVNPTTGVVTFINAPDFEAPADANGDNDYNIVLRISDGTLFQDRNVVVRVTDVSDGGTSNQAPVFTNVEPNEQVTVVEGNTLVGDANASDPNGDAVTFSIVGGADASFFSINPTTGVVTFNNAPDFETPLDADGNNIYSLTLRVSDGTLFQDRDITVRVLDAAEGGTGTNSAPFFTNVSQNEVVWQNENVLFVGDANASDANGDTLTFSIAGGADSNFFQINAQTGQLFFINAPDFETPLDSNGDNLYVVVLRVSDGTAFEDRTVIVNVEDLANA